MNQKGTSLIELMTTVAVGAIYMAALGSPAIQLMNITSQTREKIQTSLIETSVLHTLLNEDRILQILSLNNQPDLIDCLNGAGNDCQRFQTQGMVPVALDPNTGAAKYEGFASACNELSKICPIEKNFFYTVSCATANKCTGVTVNAEIALHNISNNASAGIETTKRAAKYFPARTWRRQASMNNVNCAGGVVESFNARTGQTVCKNTRESIDCDGKSVVGLGEGDCGMAESVSGGDFCTISFSPERFDVTQTNFGGVNLQYVAAGVNTHTLSYACNARVEDPGQRLPSNTPANPPQSTFDRQAYLETDLARSFLSLLRRNLETRYPRNTTLQQEVYNQVLARFLDRAERRFNRRMANQNPEQNTENLGPAPLQGYLEDNLERLINFENAGNNRGAFNILNDNYNGGAVELACAAVGLNKLNQPVSECTGNFKMVLNNGRLVTRRVTNSTLNPGVPFVAEFLERVDSESGSTSGGQVKVRIVGNGSGFSTVLN